MTLSLAKAAEEEVPEGRRLLIELDSSGDTKLIWDPSNRHEVDNARETFDKLKKKGFQAFSVTKDGSKDKVLTAFDADAEKIIMAPAIRGG